MTAAAKQFRAKGHACLPGAVVVLLRNTALGLEFHSIELPVRDKVDDATDGVGAIHRGSTAGHDVDSLQEHLRNGVRINQGVLLCRWNTVSVVQYQGAYRTEAAQAQRTDLIVVSTVRTASSERTRGGRAARTSECRQIEQ
jgi:hypothetical protein